MNDPDLIRWIDLDHVNLTAFKQSFADCVVMTHDNKILLQQRPLHWYRSAGCLTTFGGHIETGETPLQGVIRELNEELGAIIIPDEIIFLGALTEAETHHTEIVYAYFWHDRHKTITGCYECEPVHYNSIAAALEHPKIMDYAREMLHMCQQRSLLKTNEI